MNWTVLVYGGPMFFAMIWWVVSARRWFKGPKINLEHVQLGRDDQIEHIQGEDMNQDSSSTSSGEKGQEKGAEYS